MLVPHIGTQYNMDRLVSADMRHCVQEGLNRKKENFLILLQNGCYQTGNKYRPTFEGIVLQIPMTPMDFLNKKGVMSLLNVMADNYKM